MRLLALVLLATAAHASTITTAPGFTIGPVTFSNVTYTNAATDGFPMMNFVFRPGAYPEPDFSQGLAVPPVILFGSGTYTLSWDGVPKVVSETLTADFTVAPGFAVRSIGGLAVAGDSGIAVGESVTITSPCFQTLGSSGGCGPLATPLQAGTLSVHVEIHAQGCGGGTCSGVGTVGLSFVGLYLEQTAVANPEPRTWTVMIAGLGLLIRRGFRAA